MSKHMHTPIPNPSLLSNAFIATPTSMFCLGMLQPRNTLIAHIPVLCQILQRAALRLWDQERGEDTGEHESREYLHDVVEPGRRRLLGGSASAERRNCALGDDGANFTGAGRDAVGG